MIEMATPGDSPPSASTFQTVTLADEPLCHPSGAIYRRKSFAQRCCREKSQAYHTQADRHNDRRISRIRRARTGAHRTMICWKFSQHYKRKYGDDVGLMLIGDAY